MKVNKHFPFAFIYFFVNSIGLPFGLLYTTLLTPFFYIWMVLKGKRLIIFRFFLFALPFIIIHLINGVNVEVYVTSLLLVISVYIFAYTFYTLISIGTKLEGVFKKIAIVNLILTFVAIASLTTPYREVFWLDWTFSFSGANFESIPRLKM
ncbi:MAG TPA: hypothetical protein VK625_03930, partial [Flavitalea sp.]|nr:hypothetical protein [Flavitalea sp.]